MLATPFTVTTTGPVVAPVGTGVTMLVALQLMGAAIVPLNVTVLDPFVAPKFVPAMVTDVAIDRPRSGFRPVMLGVAPPPPTAGRNAASAVPQMSDVFSVPLAETGPAAVWIRSSTTNFVFGAAGTRSWMTYPPPAVNVLTFAVDRRPSTRSPLAVVVAVDVVGAAAGSLRRCDHVQ